MARKTNPVIDGITKGMVEDQVHHQVEERPAHTWPEDNLDLTDGRVVPHGVGLKEGELKALDQIGITYDVATNGLIRYAVQLMILQWREGNLDLAPSIRKKNLKRNSGKKNELKMPIE